MKKSEWYRALMNHINTTAMHSFAGQKLTKVSRGKAEVTFEIKKHHLQSKGLLHGGWYGLISDTSGFFAVMSLCGREDGATTIEYKVNLIEGASPKNSPLIAKARVIKRKGSLAVSAIDVVDRKGNIYATAIGTYRIFPGSGQSYGFTGKDGKTGRPGQSKRLINFE